MIPFIIQFFLPGITAALLAGYFKARFQRAVFLALLVCGLIVLVFNVYVPGASLLLAQFIAATWILLLCVDRHEKAPSVLLILFVSLFALTFVMTWILTGGDVKGVYDSMLKAMLAEFDKGIAIYKDSYGRELPAQAQEMVLSMRHTLTEYMPGLFGGYLFFAVLTNVIVYERLSLLSGSRPLGPDFELWKMPYILIWFFICFGFMALMHDRGYHLIGKNGIFLVCLFYLVQGFAIIKYFFKVYETPLFVRMLIYLLIGIQWYGLLMVVLTGLMDNWFDLRKRIDRSRDSSSNF